MGMAKAFKAIPSLVLVSVVPMVARAFDPFTIAAGAQAIGGILGAAGGRGADFADAAETGVALGELLTEVGMDPTADEEAKGAVLRLESLRQRVRETKALGQDVEHAIDFESVKASSHAERLKKIRRLIETIKKVGILFGAKPKVAEKALQIQQAQLNQMMLEELFAARRARLNEFLKEQSLVIERQSFLEKIQEEEKRNQEEQLRLLRARRR